MSSTKTLLRVTAAAVLAYVGYQLYDMTISSKKKKLETSKRKLTAARRLTSRPPEQNVVSPFVVITQQQLQGGKTQIGPKITLSLGEGKTLERNLQQGDIIRVHLQEAVTDEDRNLDWQVLDHELPGLIKSATSEFIDGERIFYITIASTGQGTLLFHKGNQTLTMQIKA